MRDTVMFGDSPHIALLHSLERADLLPRHVLCPVCLRLHLPHFYSILSCSNVFWE